MAAARKATDTVRAVEQAHGALKDLSPEDQQRVLTAVLALLGLSNAPARLLTSAMSAAPLQGAGLETQPQTSAARPVSLREILDKAAPATQPQKITVFAYYRERHEGLSRFSRGDLKAYFAKAKETPPGNYDRDFAKVLKMGWIHEDGSDSYLTSKGLEAVEVGFAGKALPRGAAVAKGKTARGRAARMRARRGRAGARG